MKAFKTFLSFTIPLVSMTLAYSIYIMLDKSIMSYKQSIINDYSIVVVSSSDINKTSLKNLNISIKLLEQLLRKDIIKDLQKHLSETSVELLDKKLPYFYSLYLNEFPNSYELKEIENELLKVKNIIRVETFSKNHDKIHSILILTQNIIQIMLLIIVLFGFFILIKHATIWFYEHNERISIMLLHGATTLYCAKPLINTAAKSALFSSIITIGTMYVMIHNWNLIAPKYLVDTVLNNITMDISILKIIALSFTISLVTVSIVLLKQKHND